MTVAEDDRKALATLEDESFELLLLDRHMPAMDGFNVIRALRRREAVTSRHLPTIALTAVSMKDDRQRGLDVEMDECLPKPIRAEVLYAAIDKVTHRETLDPDIRTRLDVHELIDRFTLLAACGGDPQLLDKMIGSFEAHAPSQLASLGEALKNQDAAQVRAISHKLRGLVSTFSPPAARALDQVAEMPDTGDPTKAGKRIEDVSRMIKTVSASLKNLTIDDLERNPTERS